MQPLAHSADSWKTEASRGESGDQGSNPTHSAVKSVRRDERP